MYARAAGDEEFIQAVRQDLDRRPRRRAAQAALGFLLVLMGLILMLVAPPMIFEKLSQSRQDVLRRALMGGVAVGAAAAVFVTGGLRFIADWSGHRVQDRIARLLIDHHERLRAQGSQAPPEGGRGPQGKST
jgi:hypothetical protein